MIKWVYLKSVDCDLAALMCFRHAIVDGQIQHIPQILFKMTKPMTLRMVSCRS